MEIFDLINCDIACSCGRVHRCDIDVVDIGEGALWRLESHLSAYKKILLVSDANTYSLGAGRARAVLGCRIEKSCTLPDGEDGLVVPNEKSIDFIEAYITTETDFILGVGSGVINDLCKYVAYRHGIKSGIIATAPSMDGFASSGAAMILGGMKVTETVSSPSVIVADTDIICNAPIDMIRAGYADIIGKYSALCDWKLSALVNGEYFCPEIYSIVLERTNRIRSLAKKIAMRDGRAIEELMESLVLIGVTLTLLSTTRPGSGSEHHLSHYFEITGLLNGESYFLHGTDVGYSTVVTSAMRERILKIKSPVFACVDERIRLSCYKKIYGKIADDVESLQKAAGRYGVLPDTLYADKWEMILDVIGECPSSDEITQMLFDVGFDMSLFEKKYGKDKIRNGMYFAKDLKDRYSVLWLYYSLFFTNEEAKAIL